MKKLTAILLAGAGLSVGIGATAYSHVNNLPCTALPAPFNVSCVVTNEVMKHLTPAAEASEHFDKRKTVIIGYAAGAKCRFDQGLMTNQKAMNMVWDFAKTSYYRDWIASPSVVSLTSKISRRLTSDCKVLANRDEVQQLFENNIHLFR